MVAHELLHDPGAQSRHQFGLVEDRRRREIGRPRRDAAYEAALGKPAIDEAGILAARRDLEIGRSREGRRRRWWPRTSRSREWLKALISLKIVHLFCLAE